MKSQAKVRNSSLELLRIFSMILIVLHHYTIYAGDGVDIALLMDNGFGINAYLLQIGALGELGVNLFIIIFGYFSVNLTYSWRKVFSLELQVLTYSVCTYILFCIFGGTAFTVKGFVRCLFPFFTNQYWFYSAYLILLMFSPLLNSAFQNMDRKTHLYICSLALLFWSVCPSFLLQDMFGSELIWFFMLYSIAAYLKLYPTNRINTTCVGGIIFGLCIIAIFLSTAVFDILRHVWCFADYQTHFLSGRTVFTMGASVGLFILFLNKKPFYNKYINYLASCTFGVYLIHENSYMRTLLWKKIFPYGAFVESNFLIVHIIFAVVVVFTVGTIIEIVQKNTIGRLATKLMNSRQWEKCSE